MIFARFQTKRDITRGAKTLQWGGGQHRGWGGGALAPPVYMLKKVLTGRSTKSCIGCVVSAFFFLTVCCKT